MQLISALADKRLKKLLFWIAIVLIIGAAYAALVLYSGKGIPCVFYTVTGLYCPGCGVTRMLLAILLLDFKSAFLFHPVLFCLTLPLLICFGAMAARYVKSGETKPNEWQNAVLVFSCVALIVSCVVRNIMMFI
ncbi:MAG: DUF2752 domain-containing protein [Ruminococcaceae bacterium]|nr:DUF2752 domain-containing protein [Oscillospiraceae bacterium]